MINIPPIKPGTEIKTDIIPDITRTWKTGQVLHATAETGGDALSKILLRIGQQLVEARTPIPLKTGEQIKLVVKSLGEQPVLSIQTTADRTDIAADKLRHFIAQQQDIRPLIQLGQNLVKNENINPDIRQLIQQFVNRLPTVEQLVNPTQLKQLCHGNAHYERQASVRVLWHGWDILLRHDWPAAMGERPGHLRDAIWLGDCELTNAL